MDPAGPANALPGTDASSSHLTLIFDLSPKQWHLSSLVSSPNEYALPLDAFLPQVLAFVNAHLAGRHDNSITVYGAFPGKSELLYSSEAPSNVVVARDANVYHPFRLVDTVVIERIQEHLKNLVDPNAPIGLVGAITKGLCHLNKILNPAPSAQASTTSQPNSSTDARILVLSVSPDISSSYIPIMNSIFAAQKLKVKIDVCKVFGEDTVFLQQAAHLTGGLYVSLKQRDALLQYLVMTFLAPSSVRDILILPTQDRVDLRAACFCHKNIVDVGYVCSVCLSIFCAPKPVCLTCRTKFPYKTLMRYKSDGQRIGAGAANGRMASATPAP